MKRNKRYRKDESSLKEKLEREGEHNPKNVSLNIWEPL